MRRTGGDNHEEKRIRCKLYASGGRAGAVTAGQQRVGPYAVHVCSGAHRFGIGVRCTAGSSYAARDFACATGRCAGRSGRPSPADGVVGFVEWRRGAADPTFSSGRGRRCGSGSSDDFTGNSGSGGNAGGAGQPAPGSGSRLAGTGECGCAADQHAQCDGGPGSGRYPVPCFWCSAVAFAVRGVLLDYRNAGTADPIGTVGTGAGIRWFAADCFR